MDAVYTAWRQSISSIDIGVGLKCGFKLTYDQYDGIRNLLSFEFDALLQRHRPKVEPKSGTNIDVIKWIVFDKFWSFQRFCFASSSIVVFYF